MQSPFNINRKGLQTHVEELGYSYVKLVRHFVNGATDTWINRNFTNHLNKHPSRHTVAKWRKAWESERKRDADNQAVDNLRG